MVEVLPCKKCKKCGFVYPIYYPESECQNLGCDGELKPTSISEPGEEYKKDSE